MDGEASNDSRLQEVISNAVCDGFQQSLQAIADGVWDNDAKEKARLAYVRANRGEWEFEFKQALRASISQKIKQVL